MSNDASLNNPFSPQDLVRIANKLHKEAPLFFFTLADAVKSESKDVTRAREIRPWLLGNGLSLTTFMVPETNQFERPEERLCISFLTRELIILRQFESNRKVSCIKYLRECSYIQNEIGQNTVGLGLFEAKLLCEKYFQCGAGSNYNPDGSLVL